MAQNLSEQEQRARKKESYRKWYEKNKADISARRKKKYRTDQKYREKRTRETAEYRATRKPKPPAPVTRTLHGTVHPVFSIGQAAAKLGVVASDIRKWETDGRVPPPSFSGVHRVYTEAQINLLRDLVPYKSMTGMGDVDYREQAIAKINIYTHWEDEL